jgi:colanic acid biosynthesis glycosyl transferase WcaI
MATETVGTTSSKAGTAMLLRFCRPWSARSKNGEATLKIVVHDYSGHPFQVQLSRELASRGHDVIHLHCPSYTTGKGALTPLPIDPPRFRLEEVRLRRTVAKYALLHRLAQELTYGVRSVRRVRALRPEVVLSSNVPLLAQAVFMIGLVGSDIRFVFWHQDIYSVAMSKHLARRLPLLGGALGRVFVWIERTMARASAAVVPISEDFVPTLAAWDVPQQRVSVIENWAPLDELPRTERANEWAHEHGLVGQTVFLYAGTLGLKHDPELLVRLGSRLHERGDARLVIVSEGVGAEYVRERAEAERLSNLLILPFQPYELLPSVLGAADVLIVVLEPDAGAFSVPSKVLSYQCAGRALLASLPRENLAARAIEASRSGIVVAPHDANAFVAAADLLADNPSLRGELGERARTYAEHAFDIGHIGDRFEDILRSVTDSTRPTPASHQNIAQGAE